MTICQSCGVAAPTKYVEFYQNIGALVMRFSSSVKGELCRACIQRHFLKLTGTTLALGWWGIISLVITPFILANNIYRYVGSLGLEPVIADAATAELTREAIASLQPYTDELVSRLNGGENPNSVARDLGARSGVTPGQVLAYVRYLAVMSRR